MGVNLGSPSSCSEKDQQPMRVALPPEMNFRGYSTVPHKHSYGDNLKVGFYKEKKTEIF